MKINIKSKSCQISQDIVMLDFNIIMHYNLHKAIRPEYRSNTAFLPPDYDSDILSSS